MHRRLLGLVAAAATIAAALAVGAGGAPEQVGPEAVDIVCTTYFVSGTCDNQTFGSATSNDWKLSGSYARRYWHFVSNQGACLPSYAQFQVANFDQSGQMINTHRSAPGACDFIYQLTSNGLYAKAACRIISSGGSVTRTIACATHWN